MIGLRLSVLVFACATSAIAQTSTVDPTAGMTPTERAQYIRQMIIDIRERQEDGEAATTTSPAIAPEEDDTMRADTDRALQQLLGGANVSQQPEVIQDTSLEEQSDRVASILSGYNSGGVTLDEIRGELATLVRQARSSGKEDDYVASLIIEATSADLDRIPAALKSPETGQVDTATLLKGIVAEVDSGGDSAYVEALQSAAITPPLSGTSGESADRPRIVTVRPGDTLSRIADRVYGEAFRFDAIYNANRDILSSPNVIQVGMKLRIP